MDSIRAAELSTQTTLEYLQFEIDRIAEMVRMELINSDGTEQKYSSPAFTIRLRNTLSDLPLDTATISFQHDSLS